MTLTQTVPDGNGKLLIRSGPNHRWTHDKPCTVLMPSRCETTFGAIAVPVNFPPDAFWVHSDGAGIKCGSHSEFVCFWHTPAPIRRQNRTPESQHKGTFRRRKRMRQGLGPTTMLSKSGSGNGSTISSSKLRRRTLQTALIWTPAKDLLSVQYTHLNVQYNQPAEMSLSPQQARTRSTGLLQFLLCHAQSEYTRWRHMHAHSPVSVH